MTTTSAISWYGKLPSAGDFFTASFSGRAAASVVPLVSGGADDRQKRNNASDRQFGNAPIWNFVVPPMLGGQQVQMGCLLPRTRQRRAAVSGLRADGD